MGQTANLLGVGQTITFEGKEYTLSTMTFDMQAKFETWLERRAMDAVRRQKPFCDDEEYKELSCRVITDIAAGVYSFGGSKCVEAAKTLPGVKEILYLSLQKNHKNIDRETVDRMVAEKISEIAAALSQSNPQTPAGENHAEG